MSATSIVDDRLMVYIDNKWIDAVEHMKGAIHKAAILAKNDGAATIFDELGFLIAPATTEIEEAANSAELAVKNIHEMALESLSPGKYGNLLDSLTWLCKTRKISNSLPSAPQQLTFCKSCGAIMQLNSEGELYSMAVVLLPRVSY